jgi:hypothetical protein
MNQGQYIINMQQIVLQLEQATRSSNNIDTMQIRKLCVQLQDEANYLWSWAMAAEDEMSMEQWRAMYLKHNKEAA